MIKEKENITIVTNSLKGINRSHNQDDILILSSSEYYLFILFDGISSLKESINYIKVCKKFIRENYSKYLLSEKVRLKDLLYNTHLHSLQSNIEGKATCSSLLLYPKQKQGYILNIGDSRIYEFSNHYIELLTIDDNLPGNENILVKYLGYEELTYSDFEQKPIDFHNNFILCSDGFYKFMESNIKRYFSILQFKRGKNIVNAIDRDQLNKNKDDSTYIIIKNEL